MFYKNNFSQKPSKTMQNQAFKLILLNDLGQTGLKQYFFSCIKDKMSLLMWVATTCQRIP